MTDIDLILMDSVEEAAVEWLWYPYIPRGKITLVQGDPGDGKTSMVLSIAARLTNGEAMPECEPGTAEAPQMAIYQTAEDGLADTIKPRLTRLGADCSKVAVIDERKRALTLLDSRIEDALQSTGASLLILDPLQGYLGADVDMHRANEVRPVFKRLAAVAEQTGAAVVLVGHMNKALSGTKGMYRGLGSIDIAAAARSILLVGRMDASPTMRAMAHLKSSLAPEGCSVSFELEDGGAIRWLGRCGATVADLLRPEQQVGGQTKEAAAAALIATWLAEGELPSSEVFTRLEAQGIGRRTAENAKARLGVCATRKATAWYWSLPTQKPLPGMG